jgi:hypothetical protein
VSAMHRFVYGMLDSIVVDGYGLQPDPDLAARNYQRAQEVIKRMGSKYCCHRPINDLDAELDQELTQAANSHGEE